MCISRFHFTRGCVGGSSEELSWAQKDSAPRNRVPFRTKFICPRSIPTCMCEDLAIFGLSDADARRGPQQKLGGPEGLVLRGRALHQPTPKWCAVLWDKPAGWSHIANLTSLLSIVETWTWVGHRGVLLGKLQQVAHTAWWCTICAEGARSPPVQKGSTLAAWAHPKLQSLLPRGQAAVSTQPAASPAGQTVPLGAAAHEDPSQRPGEGTQAATSKA
eukprot:2429195-Amphidinium_carterae.2